MSDIFEVGLFEELLFEDITLSNNPGPFRLLWNNLIDRDGTILTPSSQAISVNNLKNQHRKRIWRTASRLNETLIIDLANTADNIRCCALTGYNLSETATIALDYSDDGVTWTPFIGKIVDTALIIFFFFSLKNNRYWRLTLNDPDNTHGYLEIGRIFLGNFWQAGAQVLNNWALNFIDASEVKRSIGLQKWTNQREIVTQLLFQFPKMNEVDAVKNFLNIVRRIGVKNDVFVLITPDASMQYQMATGVYGRFTGIPGVTASSFLYGSNAIVFEESF